MDLVDPGRKDRIHTMSTPTRGQYTVDRRSILRDDLHGSCSAVNDKNLLEVVGRNDRESSAAGLLQVREKGAGGGMVEETSPPLGIDLHPIGHNEKP